MAGSVVQSKAAEASTSGTTLASGSFASDVTAGNRLWVVVNAGDNQTITLSQNGGTATIGTPTSLGSVQEAGVLDKYEHFDIEITGDGTLDLLVTYGATTDRRTIVAHEITGITTVDGSDATTDTGNNPTPNSTVNVSQQPAFGLAMNIDYQGGTSTVGAGWTDGGTFTTTTAAQRLQTRAISATGNVDSNFGNAGFDRNNAVLVVYLEPSPPSISAQPTQQTASVGATATFTLTAADVTTYQWQSGSDGENWSNVGTNSNSYTTGTLSSADNGKFIRCTLTNANGTIYSETVRLFIRDLAITGKGGLLDSSWMFRRRRMLGIYVHAMLRKEIQDGDVNAAEEDIWTDWWWPAATGSGISPTGIASSNAFGTASVRPRVDSTSATTSNAFGTSSVRPVLGATSATTSNAFGTPTLSPRVNPTGIASAAAFGTSSAQARVDSTSATTSNAFGSPVVDTSTVLRPTGIASSNAFGTASLVARTSPSSVTTSNAFGTTSVRPVLSPAGIAASNAFGLATLTLRLSPAGIAASNAFGTSSVRPRVDPSSVTTSNAFGLPVVTEVSGIIATGVASSNAFGAPDLRPRLSPTGIASAVAFGLAEVRRALSPSSATTTNAYGSPALRVTISPTGIASSNAFGKPRINDAVEPASGGYYYAPRRPVRLPPVTLRPAGVSSAARVGVPTVRVTASRRYRKQVEALLGLR